MTGSSAGSLEPNDAQRTLIDNTDGTYLVDAGAGTGKTFAVTRRYARIVGQDGVEPDDVLLVTFTRSGAREMRDRIVANSEYGPRDLADAPIGTFHAHCLDVLEEHGYDAPAHLGIDDHVTTATRVIEDELVERTLFAEFVGRFRDDHPEYRDRFRALDDPGELLGLLSQLAAKGIFPTDDGWYRDGEERLLGDFESFREHFREHNRPRNGGSKQSNLREALSRYGSNKTYHPEAPSKGELRGDRGTKSVHDWVAREAFEADRGDLVAFVHDVYFEYLAFALERNYLNFGFLQLFAFVVLCEDHALRDRLACEYVMVDEFQDTSEIQFKLALLLADADNLCVVGDWKQSIYSFQYADVDNIRTFESRLERFTADLNGTVDRVGFPIEPVERIELTENYRSTETILEFAERALVAPASDGERVDEAVLEDVVSLSPNAPFDETTIEAIGHADEHEAVLATVQSIVGNDDYAIEDPDAPGDQVAPGYGDVAVLTRTRDFGRELLAVADEYDVPVAYDGDVELFRTDPAKLLLAWLRILEADVDRGWAVVLERSGYTLAEIDHFLETGAYPAEMTTFRDRLATAESIGAVARQVFDRYGFDGDAAGVVLDTLQSVHDATTHTRGDMIRFIEEAIDRGSTHTVDTGAGEDSVTVRTIHSAKGLEYPIVILANMNEGAFPPNAVDRDVVRYDEVAGIRQRKLYADVEAHPHVYHDWRHDVVRHCLPEGTDEERRLLYVAITRAEHHLVLAAGEEPNAFLRNLPVELEEGPTDVERVKNEEREQAQLPFAIATPAGPVGLTPHDLMNEDVFGDDADDVGRGRSFGDEIHRFAEVYADKRAPATATENAHAKGEELANDGEPPNDDEHANDGEHPNDAEQANEDPPDERNVARFLDGLAGELATEEPAVLPLTVDGERVAVSGVVDLVHLTPETVEVVDYKTDRSRRAQEEYRLQLSVYVHVLAAAYPERTVSASIFYTGDGERVPIDPLPIETIEDRVRASLDG